MGATCFPGESVDFFTYCISQSTIQRLKESRLNDLTKLKNGKYYDGSWESTDDKDKINGKGFIYKEGVFYYQGEVIRGNAHGKGVMKWADSQNKYTQKYEGQFIDNLPYGKGTYTYQDYFSYFSKAWVKGRPGKGKIIQRNYVHEVSSIDFLDGYNHIKIEIVLNNAIISPEKQEKQLSGDEKTKYSGQAVKKKSEYVFDGEGTCYFPNGYYEGQWSNGKMHGLGKYHWKNGKIFDGEYKFGERDGQGKLFIEKNKYLEGVWRDNKKQGEFKIIQTDNYENIKSQTDPIIFKNDIVHKV